MGLRLDGGEMPTMEREDGTSRGDGRDQCPESSRRNASMPSRQIDGLMVDGMMVS